MTQNSSQPTDRVFIFVSLVAVIAVSIGGFWLLGSPTKQRLISLDTERVNDLLAISDQLWRQTGEGNENSSEPLPEILPNADQRTDTYLDPETGEPYEYRRLSDTTYELCATFALDSEDKDPNSDLPDPSWRHPAGRYCYKFDADKTTLPPIPGE